MTGTRSDPGQDHTVAEGNLCRFPAAMEVHRSTQAAVCVSAVQVDSLKQGIVAAAEESGAVMVFSGHRHTYERTFPLLGGKPAENGVVYMVSGGAGAPLDETTTTSYTAKAAAVNHFVLLNVTADNILGIVKSSNGSVLDEFTVTRRK